MVETFQFTTPQNQQLAALLLRQRQNLATDPTLMPQLPQVDFGPAYGGPVEGWSRVGKALLEGVFANQRRQEALKHQDAALHSQRLALQAGGYLPVDPNDVAALKGFGADPVALGRALQRDSFAPAQPQGTTQPQGDTAIPQGEPGPARPPITTAELPPLGGQPPATQPPATQGQPAVQGATPAQPPATEAPAAQPPANQPPAEDETGYGGALYNIARDLWNTFTGNTAADQANAQNVAAADRANAQATDTADRTNAQNAAGADQNTAGGTARDDYNNPAAIDERERIRREIAARARAAGANWDGDGTQPGLNTTPESGGLPNTQKETLSAPAAEGAGRPPYWPEIERRARELGVDPETVWRIGSRESGWRNVPTGITGPDGRPTSTATGPLQITKPTWDTIAARHPELGLTDRTDPRQNAMAGVQLTADNAQEFAQRTGRPPSPWETYLMHAFGVEGAMRLLSSDPNTQLADILPRAAAANPQWRGMTAGGLRQAFQDRMGDTTTVASASDQPPANQPAAGQPSEWGQRMGKVLLAAPNGQPAQNASTGQPAQNTAAGMPPSQPSQPRPGFLPANRQAMFAALLANPDTAEQGMAMATYQPQLEYKEIGGTLVAINPATGEVRPVYRGQNQPAAPGGYTWTPQGTLAAIPGGPADVNSPTFQAQHPPTQDQANAAGFGARLDRAIPIIRANVERLQSAVERGLGSLPLVGNYLTSPEYQQAQQAADDIINAILRRESGAAISESERESAYRQYIPRPGDSPEVVAQKLQNLETVAQNMRGQAGRAYQPPAQSNQPARPPAPQPGTVGALPQPATPAEAARLPSGTRYRDPAGNIRVRP